MKSNAERRARSIEWHDISSRTILTVAEGIRKRAMSSRVRNPRMSFFACVFGAKNHLGPVCIVTIVATGIFPRECGSCFYPVWITCAHTSRVNV